MKYKAVSYILLLFILYFSLDAKEIDSLIFKHADVLEGELINGYLVTVLTGNVILLTDSGKVTCDKAIWKRGQDAKLYGHVRIDDVKYMLTADSAFYDILGDKALAFGEQVELWSYKDSLYAVGTHAYYNKGKEFFYMKNRPVFYVNYPDSSRMIEVIADELQYDAMNKKTEAVGDVIITSKQMSSKSGCAMMNLETNNLDLFDNPTAKKDESEISGKLIAITFDNKVISKIDVVDSAHAEINQLVDSNNSLVDKSILSGDRIIFNFYSGLLNGIKCYGQAYSWYYPAQRGSEFNENSISGDTIKFAIIDERITTIQVEGGAVGSYQSGKNKIEQVLLDSLSQDSVVAQKIVSQIDTVDYRSSHIEYDLIDSMIIMKKNSWVKSGTVSLSAYDIQFDTEARIVKAFSADEVNIEDTTSEDYSLGLQPNTIPVVLRDKDEEVYGDFLEYSIDSEKGRIVQSKSNYDDGYYYGNKLFREQEDVFYVLDGHYTTCDADEPHFQFRSKNMKLIENDKLIARPVVFYIERIPIFILPYYVFPLKRGRHSGLLPFGFGKFQRGDRYVNNVGYYWAASDYMDMQAAFDYHEQNRTLTFKSRMNFKKLYVFDGYVSGEYARETSYDELVANERERTRWVTRAIYNHTITPTFHIKAYGDFQSDNTYYQDYSNNLDDRLNRETKSKLNFSKRFGKSTAISGELSHTVNLDEESRVDQLPSMGVSLPTIWLFGSGKKNDEGKLEQKWYNKITFRYSPRILNYSNRSTIDSVFITTELDSLGVPINDTTSHRSRREYAKISHNPSLNLPNIKLFKYFQINPSISYSETWFKIYETDQSLSAGINANETYRTYQYNAGASLKTNLYGTIYPNIFGVSGLRHVITPSMSYGYAPDIDRHPLVRSYAGGGAGSRKRQSIGFSINQLFQGKVKSGETEKNYDFLSLRSSFSYNFESEIKPWSNMSTSFQSSVFRFVKFDGRMNHSLYKPNSDKLSFFSPYLQSFDFNARLTFSGKKSIFDEISQQSSKNSVASEDRLAGKIDRARNPNSFAPSGWSMSAIYSYNESGSGSNFVKRSFLRMNLRFNLTPTTSVAYSQSYDIVKGVTVNNSVNIVKKLHCWTGSIYWVPIGSNRGFGFKLFVTALPEIKLDSSHDSFLESLSE